MDRKGAGPGSSTCLFMAHHLVSATCTITKPLMSGKWGLVRSTCSCLGPLLEGMMLNWTEALSWGSRVGTLGRGEDRKVDSQFHSFLNMFFQSMSLGALMIKFTFLA